MTNTNVLPIVRHVAAATVLLTLVACSGKPSGAYVAKGDAMFEKFDFQSGNQVAVSAFGQTMPAEYTTMDDGRIRVMVNGQVVTLKKGDGGCLEITAGDANEAQTAAQWGMNPGELGRFCRE